MTTPTSTSTTRASTIVPGGTAGTASTRSISRAVTGLVTGVRKSRTVLGWVSRAGWVVLASGVAALVAGQRLGWMELIVLAGSLLTLVVGERAMGVIEVRNASHRSVLPARIEMPVGTGRASFALPTLASGAEHDELFAIPTERRGVITVGPVSSVRGDPLGLIRRAVLWTEPEDLYVHPRTIKLGGSAAGFLHDLEGRETREITNADLSFHALREYVPGDDRRYVHWRSSARTGTLMVRQFEETRRSHLVLALSAQERDYGDPDEMELAISAIGSLALHALGSESDLTPMTSEEVLGHRTRRQLLDGLTRVEAVRTPTGIVELARTITRDVQRATVVVLAFGSAVPAHQIRAAGAVLPAGVRALAIQASVAEDAELGARRLGNVTVLTLPTLTELPRGFRKVER